jgi:hypothetical protein
LQSIEVTGPTTIEADWTLGGTLLLPWHPTIQRFDGARALCCDCAMLCGTTQPLRMG